MLRSISALILLIPIACFGDIPESIIGKWQFDSVRTFGEWFDQMRQANPAGHSADMMQKQNTWVANEAEVNDQQGILTITEDTISTLNNNSGETKSMSYSVVGGNSRLVVIDAASPDGDNLHINILLVEGGIARETVICMSDPGTCQRESTNRQARASSLGEPQSQTSRTKQELSQPQWLYFRPFPDRSE